MSHAPGFHTRADFDDIGITGYAPMPRNAITDVDSYKPSHAFLDPPGVDDKYFHWMPRLGARYGFMCLVGMQYVLLRGFVVEVTMDMVREADALFAEHGEPFYREGWERIVTHHGGRMPLRIRAVPEGLAVPVGNAMWDVQLSEPDPMLKWLPGWMETKLSRVFAPSTVATRGRFIKRHILDALIESSDDPMGEVDFKLQCFGSRGATCEEQAALCGFAHLVNFKGTDTVEALRFARHYYGATTMPGFSIPAAEHSTVAIWGRDREFDCYAHLVRQFLYGEATGKKYPLAACVSDTYDFYNAVENGWCGPQLLPLVRDSGGTVVIRPDSGKPAEVDLRACNIIDRKLGTTRNSKGYKVWPSYYRMIQGDGVNDESIPDIYRELLSNRFSATNLGFGMGGHNLQDFTRDTQRCKLAFSAARIDGAWRGFSKDPKTDPTKASLPGLQALVRESGEYRTVRDDPGDPRKDNLMVEVGLNGRLTRTYTLDDLRANALKGLV